MKRRRQVERTDVARIAVEGHAEPANDVTREHRAGLERANAVIDFSVLSIELLANELLDRAVQFLVQEWSSEDDEPVDTSLRDVSPNT